MMVKKLPTEAVSDGTSMVDSAFHRKSEDQCRPPPLRIVVGRQMDGASSYLKHPHSIFMTQPGMATDSHTARAHYEVNNDVAQNLPSKRMHPDATSTWALRSSISGSRTVYTNWRDHYHWEKLHFKHLPGWMRDNQHIHNHYRPQLKSYTLCLLSIFRLHTETVNIWTHLVGLVITIASYIACVVTLDGAAADYVIFTIFSLTAFSCFFNSAMFHTFCCYSADVSRFWNRLDYASIAALQIGSFISWIYYSLYCYKTLRIIYMTLLSTIGVIVLGTFLFERFTRPQYRNCRAISFVGLGLCGVAPILHSSSLSGFQYSYQYLSGNWLLFLAISYLIGAAIYAVRIPERLWPGKFDLFFHSHQYLHVSTIFSVSFHFYGMWRLANFQLHYASCK